MSRPPHREERSEPGHSADASETLFPTGREVGSPPAGDRLAEAVEVMARIRRDGQWESAQTHASLLPYLLEESWELVDAVADGDRDELVSELGDLLLQVLFHAAIGAERADAPFGIQDVAGALLDKLRRRAPYWFDDDDDGFGDRGDADGGVGVGDGGGDRDGVGDRGDADGRSDSGPHAGSGAAATAAGATRVPGARIDAAEQDRLWQRAKAAERADRPPRGVVDGLSWDMPALALGQKVLSRALSAGIPDDLVPAEMRVVHVDPTGLFRGSGGAGSQPAHDGDRAERDAEQTRPAGDTDPEARADARFDSAEVAYRQVIRRFADTVRAAESRLTVPAADARAADWRAAWPL